ncbi:MetQ/NlpA family ABC transporter substrate-binding protein [Rickettsiella endosymbiont of Dermanyssus gallinae]|uniref:MetQ/NlpA family ABC transporter substrate-binding protein n=1 Tax=Rickettsiella endosymbiont of Dermanyssus gallinae TaxID=2856608 RepID=UPI0024847778|nr:MetQ/NlpA family ABC transporter substrate-binding protein [Rickettsiella endosymbiont of Dermanyssus gallinae]
MLKKILSLCFLFSCFVSSLSGCHSESDAKQIRVGTISGPETQLMQVAKSVLLKQADLPLKIIEFSDYSLPNRALNEGSLDANMFQHRIFLDEEIKNKHYHLVALAKIFIYPMGIYSKKNTDFSENPTKCDYSHS